MPSKFLSVAAVAAAAALGVTTLTADTTHIGTATTQASSAKTTCTKDAVQVPGSSAKHSISSQGLDRDYILTVPDNYESRDDWPVIIAFHGRGSTGVEIEGYSRLSDLPAVVAYPFGTIPDKEDPRRAWQGAPYSDPEVDDVAFTEDLIDTLEEQLCVDGDQVFASGKSNGGGLALALACRIPDRIAAVAAAAPAIYPDTREDCLDRSTSPTMIIHGTADATIPYDGDERRDLPHVREWAQDLAEAARCRKIPETTALSDDVEQLSWNRCSRGKAVSLVSVDGGGHVWPGAAAYSGGGFTTHSVSGNDVVWDFFTAQQ